MSGHQKKKKKLIYLWSKVFNVGLFLLQGGLGDKHGEVAVLHTQFLNLTVKEVFNGFPDGKGPGTQHIAATDIIILNHLSFSDDLWGSSNIRQGILTILENRVVTSYKSSVLFMFITVFLELEKSLVGVKET